MAVLTQGNIAQEYDAGRIYLTYAGGLFHTSDSDSGATHVIEATGLGSERSFEIRVYNRDFATLDEVRDAAIDPSTEAARFKRITPEVLAFASARSLLVVRETTESSEHQTFNSNGEYLVEDELGNLWVPFEVASQYRGILWRTVTADLVGVISGPVGQNFASLENRLFRHVCSPKSENIAVQINGINKHLRKGESVEVEYIHTWGDTEVSAWYPSSRDLGTLHYHGGILEPPSSQSSTVGVLGWGTEYEINANETGELQNGDVTTIFGSPIVTFSDQLRAGMKIRIRVATGVTFSVTEKAAAGQAGWLHDSSGSRVANPSTLDLTAGIHELLNKGEGGWHHRQL